MTQTDIETTSEIENPVLAGASSPLPLFEAIRPEHVLPALDTALSEARNDIENICAQNNSTWETLMQPLDAIDERLSRIWGPVAHLNAVCDSDELRPAYQAGVAKMAAWQTELAQNEALYAAMRSLRQNNPPQDTERRQALDLALRDFRLAGAELNGTAKNRFKAIQMRLSELTTHFEQHVLDATQAFELYLNDERDIDGLPESVRQAAAQRAAQKRKDGWLFTLDAPSYIPFMQFATSPTLRESMYRAFVTRASSGEQDNAPLIDEILQLRGETAQLLGFSDYGAYSLASKMAASVDAVEDFLSELAEKSRSHAERELAELRAFAAEKLQIPALEAWDIPFASECLRQNKYAISQEELKPYFPENKVLNGMFALVEKLYGIHICENNKAPKWHDSVRYFEIRQADGAAIAAFYFDPYARPHKRGGAWMDECIVRWRCPDGRLQLPVAYLVCNFDAPVGDKPALWTHDEVTTLFHEFGHGLHHMLTRVEVLGVSGIRGVPWDAVELPSQFMENFCWERDVVDMFARHFDSGDKLPGELFGKMLAAKNFQSAMQMLRQIELALFDIRVHGDFDPSGGDGNNNGVQLLLDAVRDEVAVLKPPAFNRFQNSFSHIFAGGYAAGYYSYKWAEVLSADVFSAFEEEGISNRQTAARFLNEVLSVGGSRDIMQAFADFRGRKPSVDALLRHAGLNAIKTIKT
ncbi:MAG: M3 family metallopeptidase [Mariprofundaceae bacterium]|nr:M3 family metallopeptidase [Mariprofundaceae bacterium]